MHACSRSRSRTHSVVLTRTRTHTLSLIVACAAQVVSLVGGMSIDKQRRQLRYCPPIVVATPGRLWELISDGASPHLSSMRQLRFFVLDEVDRMVEHARSPRPQPRQRKCGTDPSPDPDPDPDLDPDRRWSRATTASWRAFYDSLRT